MEGHDAADVKGSNRMGNKQYGVTSALRGDDGRCGNVRDEAANVVHPVFPQRG